MMISKHRIVSSELSKSRVSKPFEFGDMAAQGVQGSLSEVPEGVGRKNKRQRRHRNHGCCSDGRIEGAISFMGRAA